MISTMLITVDGSDIAGNALRQALVLARSEKSRVAVVAVVPGYQGDLRILGESHILESLRAPYADALRQAEAAAAEFGVRIRTQLEEGDPAETILALSDSADLIVAGRKGRSLAHMIPMGSVVARIIGLGRANVLVVPDKAELRLERIVLAYDGSSDARVAADRAIGLTEAYGAELSVITVHDLPVEGFALWPDIEAKMVMEAEKIQEPLRQTVEARGIRNVQYTVRLGNPVEEICSLVRDRRAGLAVMGSRGRSGLSRLLLGSVVERTIGCVECPVWVAK